MSKPKPLEPLVQVHLMLPPELVRRMDGTVKAGVAANRTELIRTAVRHYIQSATEDAARPELKREPKA
jgi:Arc/MetJ-type ribon-helix-helix transcriptional regulator